MNRKIIFDGLDKYCKSYWVTEKGTILMLEDIFAGELSIGNSLEKFETEHGLTYISSNGGNAAFRILPSCVIDA